MAAGAAQQEMINQMVAGAVEAMEASVDAVSYLLIDISGLIKFFYGFGLTRKNKCLSKSIAHHL